MSKYSVEISIKESWSKEKEIKVTINTAKLMEYESIIGKKERGLR
jgi:hypothetical protein